MTRFFTIDLLRKGAAPTFTPAHRSKEKQGIFSLVSVIMREY